MVATPPWNSATTLSTPSEDKEKAAGGSEAAGGEVRTKRKRADSKHDACGRPKLEIDLPGVREKRQGIEP